jgi:uncharacterized protein (TIGR02679 family)
MIPYRDLADPDLNPLWQALAARLANGEDPARIQQVKIVLSRAGRAMLNAWLAHDTGSGRTAARLPTDGDCTVVSLPRLLRALRLSPDDLPAVVVHAVGAYPDRAGDRLRAAQLRNKVWDHAQALLGDAPRLMARLRAAGVADDKADDLLNLINALGRARHRLPLPRPVPLARLALVCAGDPHYFDLNDSGHGNRLVLLAVDLLNAAVPDSPAAERAALARVGVIADRLSQTILTFNLEACGHGPTDRALQLARSDQRPVHLTLHDLTAHPPTLSNARPWLVVENPSVVEEALIRNSDLPIACTSGALTAVDHVLLGLARDAGVPMRYNGDLDPVGLAVAEVVRTRYRGVPWHMGADTYRAALADGPLATQPPPAPVLPGPSRIPIKTGDLPTLGEQAGDGDAVDGQRWVVFQEHRIMIEQVLGHDPGDPLESPV